MITTFHEDKVDILDNPFDAQPLLNDAWWEATHQPTSSLSAQERAAAVKLIGYLLSRLQAPGSDSSRTCEEQRRQLVTRLRRLGVLMWRDRGPDGQRVVQALLERQREEARG